MRSRSFASSSVLLSTCLVGCAEPCIDDGLLQDHRADCPIDTGGSTSDGIGKATLGFVTTTSGSSSVWCVDGDGDGFGDPNDCFDVPTGAPAPDNAVPIGTAQDCADDNPHAYVGAAPLDATDRCLQDADGDGYGDANPGPGVESGTDCDDTDPDVHPGAALHDAGLCVRDRDGDGFGDADPPDGIDAGTDCDDTNPSAHPGAATNDGLSCTLDADGDGFGDDDPPDGIDPGSDCDDRNPHAFPGSAEHDGAMRCTLDADGDGFGDDDPPRGIEAGTDCDDDNEHAFPGAAELDDPEACMEDADDDGYGDNVPPGGVTQGSDCDDANPMVPDPDGCTTWCVDGDGDGYGDPEQCDPENEGQEGYVSNGADCADDRADVFPGAAREEGDLCTLDADGDGWGSDDASQTVPGAENGTDCNDANPDLHPGAASYEPSLCTIDADGDGYGDSNASDSDPDAENGTDCDDGSVDITACLSVDAGACIQRAAGESVSLHAQGSGGSGTYGYSWSPADALSATDIPDPIANPTTFQSYVVTVDDGFSTATDTVTVLDSGFFDLAGHCELVAFDLSASEGAPSIVYRDAGTVACEPINGDVGLHLCDVEFENTRLEGTMRVDDNDGDDDNFGFVWGAQDETHFFHFTWKRADQPQASNVAVCPDGGTNLWPGGMMVKRVEAPTPADLTLQDLFCAYDTPNSTVVHAPADIGTTGWVFGVDYRVRIEYTRSGTEITITDTTANAEVASFTVDTGGTPTGRFGTLTYSQSGACNGPWTATCIAP